ncbi:Gmad2 immunoglobulin-like domain-containing protein [Nocardioides sp. Iso805N]|uniref:Gmad2 immunoglobulin-like domain-containing protein n=1 Tax=Nocardioides sp. Iso805N TaxID=1283287 RepID=UPI000361F65F|nr:Gmad2 immunoglobulin-like domain-containing protein [Nocardioides sp. Iso805N]
MTVLPFRRRTAAALAVGALLLTGVAACGSGSDATADDPDTSAVSGAATDTATGPASDSAAPSAAATASAASDGAAPASVSIESPANGTKVGETLSVRGTANSPEANVPWEVDSPIDGVVVSGSATADGWLDKAYPWKAEINVSALQPGTYTFTARVDDDSNKEGSKPPEATITFTKN